MVVEKVLVLTLTLASALALPFAHLLPFFKMQITTEESIKFLMRTFILISKRESGPKKVWSTSQFRLGPANSTLLKRGLSHSEKLTANNHFIKRRTASHVFNPYLLFFLKISFYPWYRIRWLECLKVERGKEKER